MSHHYWKIAAVLFFTIAVGFFLRAKREHQYRVEAEAAAVEYVQKLEECEAR